VSEEKAKEYLNKLGDGIGFTVLWSGGKDSTASLLWVLEHINHENWDILFVEVTGNTHPLNVQYVLDVAKQLGVENKLKMVKREDIDFYDYLVRYGLPTLGRSRWCLNKFKEYVWQRQSRFVQVSGIRRTDSVRRQNVALIEYMRATKNITVQPILDWTKQQVLAKIREWGLELNSCYEKYGHSGNCMFCPYHSRELIIRTLNDSEWGPKIINALKQIRNRNPNTPSGEKLLYWMRFVGQRQLI